MLIILLSLFPNFVAWFDSELGPNTDYEPILISMSRKTVKNEESAMDRDEFAEKVKAKLMPSIERMMREIIKQEVANLVSEAVRSELRSMTEGFNKIVEENRSLKIRVDNLEMQSRSNNLVIHGLPETSYAEAASTSEDAGGVVLCILDLFEKQ